MRTYVGMVVGLVVALGLAALAGAARGDDVMTELPKGCKVAERAASREALIAKTKPILMFQDNMGEGRFMDAILVWTAKDGETRTFTLATAQAYWPKGGKAEWVILKADAGADGGDGVLPQTTVTVREKKPAETGSKTVPWARVASMDPKRGTLYELGYFDQVRLDGACESRVYLLHDPEHGWRFVASLMGDELTDSAAESGNRAAQTIRNVAVKWTGKGDSPVELTVETQGAGKDDKGKALLVRYTEARYAGVLPLTEVVESKDYLKVGKGDTLSGLVLRLAREELLGEKEATVKKAARALEAEVMALNPKLEAENLQVGQRVYLPSAGRMGEVVGRFRGVAGR